MKKILKIVLCVALSLILKINGVVKYKYSYNGNGDLYSVEDIDNNTTYCYNYDYLPNVSDRGGFTVNENGGRCLIQQGGKWSC